MPTASKFKKLNVLSPDQMLELDAMLIDGKPASVIADVVQKDWGLFADEKHATVKKMLERYRSQEIKQRVVQQLSQHVTQSHVMGISKKLNAIEALTELTLIQQTRFQKGLMQESKSPLLMGGVSAEAKLLKEMLTDLGKLQLETGIIQRAPKKLSGTMVNEDGSVATFEWTEEQRQLYNEIETFEEDGVYQAI